jgi:hypothetical protein
VVIDPSHGIAQAPDVVSLVRAELDSRRVASIRRRIPVLVDRWPKANAASNEWRTAKNRPETIGCSLAKPRGAGGVDAQNAGAFCERTLLVQYDAA